MSTTIGLGYSTRDNAFKDKLRELASQFGYGLLSGIGHIESDVRSGIEVAMKNEKWPGKLPGHC